jgi:hypothetical protein
LENDPESATLMQLKQLADVHGVELAVLIGIDNVYKYYEFFEKVRMLIEQL